MPYLALYQGAWYSVLRRGPSFYTMVDSSHFVLMTYQKFREIYQAVVVGVWTCEGLRVKREYFCNFAEYGESRMHK